MGRYSAWRNRLFAILRCAPRNRGPDHLILRNLNQKSFWKCCDYVHPRSKKRPNKRGTGMPTSHKKIQPKAPFSFPMIPKPWGVFSIFPPLLKLYASRQNRGLASTIKQHYKIGAGQKSSVPGVTPLFLRPELCNY